MVLGLEHRTWYAVPLSSDVQLAFVYLNIGKGHLSALVLEGITEISCLVCSWPWLGLISRPARELLEGSGVVQEQPHKPLRHQSRADIDALSESLFQAVSQ